MAAKLEVEIRNETCRKPYKVCGKDNQFKGLVASSLDDFKVTACNALELPFGNDLKVFLYEDMTEVGNDEYFQFLPAQTKLVVLQEGETASFGLFSNYTIPHFERSESLVTSNEECIDGGPVLEANLKQRIISDEVFYVNLNDKELESFISVDPNLASLELKKTKEEIFLYQEACERELLRRSELRSANELLKLYHRVNKDQNNDSAKYVKKLKLSKS